MMRDNGIPALTASYPASFLRQGDGSCCTLSARLKKFEVLICLLLVKTWPGCFRGYQFCDPSIYGVPALPMGKGLETECLSALGSSPSGSTSPLQGMSSNHPFQSPPCSVLFICSILSQLNVLLPHKAGPLVLHSLRVQNPFPGFYS